MKKACSILSVLLLGLWAHAAVAHQPHQSLTPEEQLIEGPWSVVHMVRGGKSVQLPPGTKMTMTFRGSDHSWRFTIATKERSFVEAGTWQLNGSMLTTRSEDGSKVERMRVRRAGEGVIELKKTDERLLLARR